jgi:hypothetical protein
LFNNSYDTKEAKTENNIYLKDNHRFLLAKEAIKTHQINFIHASLQDICQNNLLADKTYDAIILSNISDYSQSMFPGKSYLQQFKTEMIDHLIQHTNKNGVVMIGYVYGNDERSHRSDIDDLHIRKSIFTYNNYKETEIPSVLDARQKDIFLYTSR